MKRPPLPVRWAARVHGSAVLLLPRSFREAFAAEIRSTFLAAADRAWGEGGGRELCWLTARAVGDCAIHATVGRGELREASAIGRRTPGGWVERTLGGGSSMSDLRNGLRQLARRPALSVAAIVTLALGIGANTSMFSIVNGVLIQSLPFPEPDRLVRLFHANPARGTERANLSVPDIEDWRSAASALTEMAVYSTLPSGPLLTGGEEPKQLDVAYVSGGYFGTLGVPADIGRGLTPDEEYGDNRVVVLSHEFWLTAFGGDAGLVGRTVTLNDEAYRVVGVMPPSFSFPGRGVQAWMFLSVIPETSIPLQNRGVRFLQGIGRLAENVTLEAARDELTSISRALAERYPDQNEGLDAATLVPLRETITAGVSRPLTVLLMAVSAVLLIACVNVAGLLLSRGVERSREVALRTALGAGRGRLLRQFVTEAAVLAGLGGALGVSVAFLLHGTLVSELEALLPRAGEIRIDGTVLAFAVMAVSASALLFGIVPAFAATRRAPLSRLHDGGRGSTASGASRTLWNGLIAAEVALALLLVLSAGLLVRSVWELQRVDPGLDPDGIAIGLTFNAARYPTRPDYLGAYDRLVERIEAVPGVDGVGSIRSAPASPGHETTAFDVVGRETSDEELEAAVLQVSPGFFHVAGTPLIAGREFTSDDRADAPLVTIVNEAFMRRFFPDGDVLGAQVDGRGGINRIVGVVGDIRQYGPGEPATPTFYVPQAQNPRRGMTFIVSAEADPVALLSPLRSAIRSVDPDQPIESLALVRDVLHGAADRERFFATLLAGFGLLGLGLASVGIYGVVSTAVGGRTSEIGTRMALGATRPTIVRMVVRTALGPVWVGVGTGLLVAWTGATALDSIVFGVRPRDPLMFAGVTALLIAVAALASWVPAGRASRLDPVDALRAD